MTNILAAVFDIAEPKNVPIRLTALATLGEWQEIAAALKTAATDENYHSASNKFIRAVDEVARKAKMTFISRQSDAEE